MKAWKIIGTVFVPPATQWEDGISLCVGICRVRFDA
jgi:hypothetical protein